MNDKRARNRTTIQNSNDLSLVGKIVEQISVFNTKSGKTVSFVTPSIAHLSLNAAIKSAHNANECRSQLITSIPTRTVIVPPPTHYSDGDNSGMLFDTFLHVMSAAIFSYLAVENYANEVIGRHPEHQISLTEKPRTNVRGRKSQRRLEKKNTLRARDAERKPLNIKLTQILPQITGIEMDKGRSPYQLFDRLEKVRDGVTHLKSKDSAPRIRDLARVPTSPLLTGFLLDDSLWMPRAAIDIIDHFTIETMPVDWVETLRDATLD